MPTTLTYLGAGVAHDAAMVTAIATAMAADKKVIIPTAAGPWTFDGPAGLPGINALTGVAEQRQAIAMQSLLDLEINGDVLGRNGNFLGTRDCMIAADKVNDWTIHGTGTVRMGGVTQFGTYANPVAPYTGADPGGPAEWRHCVRVRGCSRWSITGAMNLNGAGGDGLIIAPSERDQDNPSLRLPCTDFLVSGAIMNANLRQGCSIISARRGTLINCGFTNSLGVSPQSGLDIEPEYDNIANLPDYLDDLRVLNCYAHGSASRNFLVNLTRMKDATPTISLLMSNCWSNRAPSGGADPWGWDFIMTTGGPLTGTIYLNDCGCRNIDAAALRLKWRLDQGPQMRFHRFVINDCGKVEANKPIIVESTTDVGAVRRVTFDDVRVRERYNRAIINRITSPSPCRELQGTILVDRILTFLPGVSQTTGFPLLQYETYRERQRRYARELTYVV